MVYVYMYIVDGKNMGYMAYSISYLIQSTKNRIHKHKDPRKHDCWDPPYIGPWNPIVRSSCLYGLYVLCGRNQILLSRHVVCVV